MHVRWKEMVEFLAAGSLFAAGIYGYMCCQETGGQSADGPGAMYLLVLPGGAALAGLFRSCADPHRRGGAQGGSARAAWRARNTSEACGLMNSATSSG